MGPEAAVKSGPMGPPGSSSVVALFSTHLFHLRERKALLVAYPSTSATLSVGEWAARWPQERTRRTVERVLLSRLVRERAPLGTSISRLEDTPARGEAAARLWY